MPTGRHIPPGLAVCGARARRWGRPPRPGEGVPAWGSVSVLAIVFDIMFVKD